MREFIDYGVTTPPNESCAQVGSREYDYYERARQEARVLINQLRRVFGNEPGGAQFALKSHPHDFGTYLTVGCYAEAENQVAMGYAAQVDAAFPSEWDEQAQEELHQTERR